MRRLLASWLYLLFACAAAAGGCGGEEEDKRRELLRPVDLRQQQIARFEKKRLFDESGELLPSGETIADGLELPKGLKLYRSFEYEWYYEAHGINIEQLERYFAKRLDPGGIDRTATRVTFEKAQLREKPSARVVNVQLAALIGTGPASDVYIRQAEPPRAWPSEREAEAQMEARRQRAE